MAEGALDVIGIGNAIVDVLTDADDAFLDRHGLIKGAMQLVDGDQAERLYEQLGTAREASGGSAANTMAGIASLGGRAGYIGKVRDDALGRVFRREIRAAGVEFDTPAAEEGPSTGRCLIFVTPDAQRTMNTYLGISATLSVDDIDPAAIERAGITYLEGYLWDPAPAKQAFLKAAEIAHNAGRKVALSLSDSFCVDRHRSEFRDLVAGHVDVLFANEDEIVALFEAPSFDRAVEQTRDQCEVAALTRGDQGAVVVWEGSATRIDAEPVSRVVDTTGAGDLYAAGFLFGMTEGRDAAGCGRLGAIAAAEVIGHFGARPKASLRELVKSVR